MNDAQVIALMAATLMAGDSAAQGTPPNYRPDMHKPEIYANAALALFQAAQKVVLARHCNNGVTV